LLYSLNPSPHASNWFQDFVVAMITEVLSTRSRQVVAKAWEDLPPPEQVQARHGLKTRYSELVTSSLSLTPEQAKKCLLSIGSASFYEDVLAGKIDYKSSFLATDNFQKSLNDLVSFAFKLLSALKNNPGDSRSFRDELYAKTYDAMPERICPFCGLSPFDAPHPDMPRHAYDHYLAISAYPIFGTYLPNLVPMCDRCNSSFKGATDLLADDAGNVRSCVDPHGNYVAQVSLMRSEPFANDQLPRWDIAFVPSNDAFETWDEVFKVRFRYEKSVLDVEFKPWLDEFSKWALRMNVQLQDSQSVSDALSSYAALHPGLRDRGFIKGPMFEMLAASALRPDATGTRVTEFVKALCAE
jgi:hypothetical protein